MAFSRRAGGAARLWAAPVWGLEISVLVASPADPRVTWAGVPMCARTEVSSAGLREAGDGDPAAERAFLCWAHLPVLCSLTRFFPPLGRSRGQR